MHDESSPSIPEAVRPGNCLSSIVFFTILKKSSWIADQPFHHIPPSSPRDANSCTVLLQAEISRHSSGRKASRFSGVITLHPPRSHPVGVQGAGGLEPNREVIQVTRSSVMGGLTGLPGSCQPVARVCWRLEVAAARKTVGAGWSWRGRRGEEGG